MSRKIDPMEQQGKGEGLYYTIIAIGVIAVGVAMFLTLSISGQVRSEQSTLYKEIEGLKESNEALESVNKDLSVKVEAIEQRVEIEAAAH